MTPSIIRDGPIRPPLAGELLARLARAVSGVRGAGDSGTASSVVGPRALDALGADEVRLLRMDPRGGTLHLLEGSGEEIPYRAEEGGPVERLRRQERAIFDEGQEPARSADAPLWSRPPASLAALPLFSGNEMFGCLLLGFAAPRSFDPEERLALQVLADTVALALGRVELRQSLDDERARCAEVERRLEVDEETSSNLMSVVAHEIRAPLTAIKAYTESLIDTLGNPHTPRERFLNIINQECDRLGRLVADILDLSRLEAGQRPLRLARFDPDGMAREVIGQLQPLATGRHLAVDLAVEPGLVVEADTDLVRRLLVNLLGNAIKFSPVGGHVWVRVRPQGDEWIATVEDEGPGIPPEELSRVFERFYRGAHPDPQTEGAGLGLAISRGIVELHGGRIWAEARPGGGARFGFAMPLRQMASAHVREVARRVLERRDLRALLDRTVEMIAAMMDAEIVSLMVVDPDRGDLFVAASRGFEGKNVSLRRTLVRSGVAGSVAARGRPLLVNNIETDRRFQRINHPQYSTKSLLSVPLRVENQTLGVINVNNKASREAFDENDLAVLTVLVERVGGAVERAFAHPEGGRAVEEASEAIQSITRLKREGLLGGRSSVGMARAVARKLGMSPAEHDVVAYAAAVRDVGMSTIQGRLAGVRGPLDADERQTLVQHPEAGAEMIRPLEQLGPVCELVLAHHERWDGAGYPRGLKGHEIPLGARILAAVDAFESMTAGRPYRATRTLEQAIAELRRGAGSQFDPDVVETMVRLLEGEGGSGE